PAGGDREVDPRPLGARVGEESHAITGRHARVDEARGDGAYARGHRLPGDLAPAVRDAVAVARSRGQLASPPEEHLCEVRVRHACPFPAHAKPRAQAAVTVQ